jgi:hypothetical protein
MIRLATALVSGLIATTALAADTAHKVDFTAILTDIDNVPIYQCTSPINIEPTDPACKTKQPLTLGLLAVRALMVQDQTADAPELRRRADLGIAVYHAKAPYDLTQADADLIKARITAVFHSPLFDTRVNLLLTPADTK